MSDYGRKTVVELQEILKSRSLPYSGKKADLVARLNQADKSTESKPSAGTATDVAPSVAEPDVGEEAPIVGSEPALAPQPSEEVLPEISTPIDGKDASSLALPTSEQPDREASVNTDSNLAAATDYSMGLGQSSYDDELKKRKARAERFGASAQEVDTEALRAVERAKRFGTTPTSIGKLDEALPMGAERRSKRVREGDQSLDDPGLKQGRGGKRRVQGGGVGRNERRGERPTGVQRPVGKATSVFSGEKDRLAAEARKKKFGVA